MELEQLLTLIQTVSDSKLTEFKYETETLCVKMGKESSVKVVTADPQMMAAVPAASAVAEAPGYEKRRKAPEGKDSWHPLLRVLLCSSVRGRCSVCTGRRCCKERPGSCHCGGNEADE